VVGQAYSNGGSFMGFACAFDPRPWNNDSYYRQPVVTRQSWSVNLGPPTHGTHAIAVWYGSMPQHSG